MKLQTLVFASTSFIILGSAKILEVKIDAGRIQGSSCQNSESTSFLGIPYAIPPVGELRWKAPQKYNSTFDGGSLNATSQPNVCHQFTPIASEPGPYSEDCLFLNVWVPESADKNSTALPVKVFIHGGANAGGSIPNPLYNGCNLADDGAIVVNVAYRLGPLGFLALESAGIAGNFGIQDIILGLEWVQENIGSFGGDKDKVLVFGQSAGALNAWIISTLPDAPELMSAVALQSGGGVDFQTNTSAQQAGTIFVSQLNCTFTDADCLRSLEPEQLMNIGLNPDNPGVSSFTVIHPSMQPYIDGLVIPEQPAKVGSRVPAVFGFMGQDGTFFVLVPSFDPTSMTEELLNAFASYEFGPLADEVLARYPPEDFQSFPVPLFYRASQIVTDYAWKCPAYRGAKKTAENGIPAWTYIFQHQSSCPQTNDIPKEISDILGAVHGGDISYVFGNIEGYPYPNGTCNYNQLERNISNTLIEAYTSLAVNGNASTDSFDWPSFNNETYQGLYVGPDSYQAQSLAANFSICEFWDQINLLLREATEKNHTNTTEVIPPSPTISDITLPTQSEPSKGFRALEVAGSFAIAVAVIVAIIGEFL